MATARDDRGDLSVELDWPADPLSDRAEHDERDISEDVVHDVASRLDVLETAAVEGEDHLVADVVDVLRAMHETLRRSIDENLAALDDRIAALRTAMMSMLASRQADDQHSQRRDRDELVEALQQELDVLAQKVDTSFEDVAAELKSLRRRMTVRGGAGASLDEPTMEELVARIADEVEIRVAAALKPKAAKRR
jgi:hypothetical protein